MPSINLDKIEFYKEDYEGTGEVPITGNITGLDPNKQYCVWIQCYQCNMWYYLHGPIYEYFYITGVSSITIPSGSHIHSGNLVWYPGEDYCGVGIYLDEVSGNCETIINPIIASANILVYNTYETETGLLVCNSSPEDAQIFINGTNTNEFTPKSFTDMEAGSYSVMYKKAGYNDCSVNVIVVANQGVSAFCSLIEILEFCTQTFSIIDQDGLPLNGVISSPSWGTDLNVPSSGMASLYMLKGVTQTATAYYGGKSQSQTFTSCTTDSVVFVINITKFCSQSFKVIDNNNIPVTDVKISIEDVAIWSVDSNGEYTHSGLTQGQTYNFSVLQSAPGGAIEIYKDTFVACTTTPLIIQVTKQEEPKPGELGIISYEIISSVGNDEIKFTIPVTNKTSDRMCYYVDLYNELGIFLERTPEGITTLALNSNESGTLYMNSVLAQFPAWDITDVQNQNVTFKLRAAKAVLGLCPPSGYEIADEKIVSIERYEEGGILNVTVNDTSNIMVGNVVINVMHGIFGVCDSPKEIPLNSSVAWVDLSDRFCLGRLPLGSKLKVTVTGYDDLGNVYSTSKDVILQSNTSVTLDMADAKTGDATECFIDNPLYPIKSDNPCLLTNDQANTIKWVVIIGGAVYGLTVISPLIKGAGSLIEKTKDE